MSELSRNPQTAPSVLVVEDESAICELLSETLEDAGFDPYCVQSDRQAYDALRRDADVACMIVDINLGAGTTGYDVARFAREIDPALPVIFVSGQTSEASMRSNGVPGSLFLPKPFTPGEVLENLRKLVGDNDD